MTWRRQTLPLLLLLLGLAGPVGATTYYVDASRPDDTGDGLSWAAAEKTLGAAVTDAQGGAGPHTIYVTGSQATAVVTINHANLVGLSIIGVSRTSTVLTNDTGRVFSIGATMTGITIENLTVRVGGGNSAIWNAATGSGSLTLRSLDITSRPTHTSSLVYSLNGATITRCRLQSNGGSYSLNVEGSGTLNYSTVEAVGYAKYAGGLNFGGASGTWDISNNVLLDFFTHAVLTTSGQALNVINNVIQAAHDNGYCIWQGGTSAVTAKRNWLISNMANLSRFFIGTVTEGVGAEANIKLSGDPRFRTQSRVGYIVPRVDDTANFAYAQSVAALLSARGQKGSFYMNTASWTDNDGARQMVRDGVMEFACHGATHSELTFTGKFFDVTKAGQTITINRAAGTITLSGGGAVANFRTKGLGQIKTELEALGATVTPVAAYGVSLSAYVMGEAIADGVGVNTLDALIDATAATGYFKTELVDSKAIQEGTIINGAGNVTDPQTGATYACNTFAYPGYLNDANVRAATRAAGWNSGQGTNTIYANQVLLPAYQINQVTASVAFHGQTEAVIRERAGALANAAARHGLIIPVIAHTAAELTLQEWGWMLDEWAKWPTLKLRVTSAQIAMREVIAASADNGDGTYTRTWTDANDFRLQCGSPLLDAGVDVGLTSDLAGNRVPLGVAPDIGAYENMRRNINVHNGTLHHGEPQARGTVSYHPWGATCP